MSVGLRSQEELREIVNQDRPMQVFIMGMPRSGTMSLFAALEKLGYTPYSFIDRVFLNHLSLWTDALRAKFLHQGKPWGRPEFDRVFEGFDCVLDVPCTFFPSELTAAYPDALTILNTRPPAPWLASMNSTLFHVFRWPSWPLLSKLDPGFTGKWYTHCMLTWDIFCGNDYGEICKEKYLEHYEHVRRVVPKERLLEYDVKEGWEPLCRFLGKEVPQEEFPNVNDKDYFVRAHGTLWMYSVMNAVKNVGIGMLSVAVGLGAWWVYAARYAQTT
ncbi:MAG: hypothetical protein Q9219_006311 [cf. Caloplaca sp. 3 TL-2023]